MEKKKILLKIGQNLRILRLNAGLTQEGLAAITGLDRTYIGGIERGERNPTLFNLVRISQSLDIPISTLLEGVDKLL